MLKKTFLILTSCFLLGGSILAQDISLDLQKPVRQSSTELTKRWNQQPATVLVGFASSSVRYQQDIPASIIKKSSWNTTAWKNEKVHTQLVISTKKNITNVTLSVSNLINARGSKISNKNIAVGFVQYVMTDEFKNGCGHRKSVDFDSSWVADIINTDLKKIDINKNTTQPIWLTIEVPENTPAGKYSGVVTVKVDKTYNLPFTIIVLDRILPSPKDWSFRLDYWQHPAAVARVHNVKLWSDEHFSLMRKYYTMLANAGQKIITAGIVDEPWGHQTYDDYPSLIQWTKKTDGSWKYDYTLFDKYIDFVMSCGIKDQINCYSMVPWKIAFKYYDESIKKDTVFTGAIGTSEYNEFWRTMLTDFTAHLKNKGWFEKTTIAMDERPMKAMMSVIDLLKTIDPNWKVSLAGDYHPEIEKDIYDYCVASRWTFPKETLEKRQQQGKHSTWYTCCTEKYPNQFSFSPPDESVWTGWYTAATKMDGFLRWAYNSWTQNPLVDTRFTAWPAGDTYQVYPGPLSSIRFEKLIEGVQDFEKINYLRKKYQSENNSAKLKELETALATFKIEKLSKETAQQMVEKYKHLLN